MSEKVPYKKALEMLYEKNAEIDDLRARLEKAQKMLDNTIDDLQNLAEKNLDFETENAALKQKLEKAHMDLANAEHNVAENIKQEVMMWIDKCIALEQKLVAVKEWMDSRQADSVVKLRKIIDGE